MFSLVSFVLWWYHFTVLMAKDIDPEGEYLAIYLIHAVIPQTLDAPYRALQCARSRVLLPAHSLKSD